MFIRKITKLKNIGMFVSAGISGGEYDRFTLIYGGNGRGKSTLCSVLRSLQRNEPKDIEARKTFGAQTNCEAQLLMGDGTVAAYSNGQWSRTSPDIHIFDTRFVSENVYGGDLIAVDQRRNIYKIAVGEKGVELAAEISRLDVAIDKQQAELSAQKKVVEQHLPESMTLSTFLEIEDDAAIDTQISETATKLKAARESDIIARRPEVKKVTIPTLPEGFLEALAKSVDGVSLDATKLVEQHLATHQIEDHGREWISELLPHTEDECLFCGQQLKGIALVEAYKGYFSEGYDRLRTSVNRLEKSLDTSFGEAAGLKISAAIESIGTEATFWATYIADLKLPQVSGGLKETMDRLHTSAIALIDQKQADILQTVFSSQDFDEALAEWSGVEAQLKELNDFVDALTKATLALRAETKLLDAGQLERHLAGLEIRKNRYAEHVVTQVAEYTKLVQAKKDLVAEKDAAKLALDAYDAEVLKGYEEEINEYLMQFGANFRLSRTAKNYNGGTPQSSYCLKFGTKEIDAAESGKGGEPSFGTTLSAGDRSTLALAFFMAQAKRDPRLSEKLVVFDDPFTSLDDFRREMTAKSIVRLGQTASQTIVLSHDKYFLDTVKGMVSKSGLGHVAIQIATSKRNSSISPWDIEREVKEGFLQAHMAVSEFAEGITDDAASMRTALRPLLESYIRYRFPNQIPEGIWLGEMIGIIRNNPDHPLQGVYADLDDINAYTAPFHHNANEPFNPDEVRTFAVRTLKIVGGH